MKIVKVNDNIKVNIEQIYSLEHYSNIRDIEEWDKSYNKLIGEFYQDSPFLEIDGEYINLEMCKTDETLLEKYVHELNNYIINIIGNKPKESHTYYVILASGLKVDISKSIYNAIDKVLDKYII